MKARTGKAGISGHGVLAVDWDTISKPLDITVHRNGAKVPTRKVKVRGIVGDAWLEQEARLDKGSIRRLVAAVKKLARHGYEARLADSIRFVHMFDQKNGLYLSPQLLQPFKDEVLKGVDFRLTFEGREVCNLDEARTLNIKRMEDENGGEAVKEVTPDIMITCDVCGNHIRVGKKLGK